MWSLLHFRDHENGWRKTTKKFWRRERASSKQRGLAGNDPRNTEGMNASYTVGEADKRGTWV